MKTNNRVYFFDTAKAICMIWIVCIWHLSSSLKSFPDLTNPICNCITVGALSTFAFISAFFVSGKVQTPRDILQFYKKRLSRFYILYFISCLSMLIGKFISKSESMMSVKQFFLSLFGLSTIVGPSPITLWFLSMLILFYAITPFIDLIKQQTLKIIILLIIGILITCVIFAFNGDKRVLVYYPSYCFGLILSKKTKESITSGLFIKSKKFIIFIIVDLIILVCSIILYHFHYSSSFWFLYRIPISITMIGVIITLSKLLSVKIFRKAIGFLGYISMCVYLFHSQVFLIAELVFGKMNYWQAYIVIIPVLFLVCFATQKIYDMCFEVIKKKENSEEWTY